MYVSGKEMGDVIFIQSLTIEACSSSFGKHASSIIDIRSLYMLTALELRSNRVPFHASTISSQ